MKKIVLLCTITLTVVTLNAQLKVGNNPATIGTGQLLELEKKGQRGGLKLAEVALTGAADNTTIAINASSAGTLVWNNGTAGLAPAGIYVWTGSAWVQAKTDNLYTANGTLTGNRIVALANNTLAFTSTASDGTSHFSVDGSTFNVDAFNNRVGIGTATPTNNLEVSGTGGTGSGLKLPTGAEVGKVLTSDASGNASWQNGYSVVYSEIYGGGGIIYNSDAKILLNNTRMDNVKARYGAAYGWDNTNKWWVAPFNGVYRVTINASFLYLGPYGSPHPGMKAFKNGTHLCALATGAPPGNSDPSAGETTTSSALVHLNAGEYIEFRAYNKMSLSGSPFGSFIRVESVEAIE